MNYREIDAVLGELDLVGLRLREIRQPDFGRIILEFAPHRPRGIPGAFILIGLVPGLARIHAVESRSRALPRPPRFTALLKSRLRGAMLRSIEQLGSDRIVVMVFGSGESEHRFYAKLWNQGANLVLTRPDGEVIDAFSRRPGRGEAPGGHFPPRGMGESPPPPEGKYAIRDLPESGSINRGFARYYGNLEEARQKAGVLELWDRDLRDRTRRIEARRDAVEKRALSFQGHERDRHWGDIIMAHLHRLPPGEKFLEAEDWETDATVRIPLNPSLDARGNAEAFYRRARRAKRGLERIREDREAVDRGLAELHKEKTLRESGVIPDDVVSRLERQRDEKRRNADGTPGLTIPRGSHLILVGRSAKESDALLRHHVRGNDLWLHTRDYPGGHVFIRSPRGKSVPLEVLLDAGNLAVAYSKARNSGGADLYYTRVKHLRRPKDGPKGKVIPTKEKNLRITVEPDRLAMLRNAAVVG